MGAFLYIDVAHNGFGNDGNALHEVTDKLGTLDGVFSCIFKQQIGFKADKVRFILLYEVLEFRRIVFAGKGVRIVTVGQEANFYVHAFFQQHVNTSDRGLYTGSVTVVEHCHVVGEAMNHPDLSGCQCCARRGNHILYARLVHGNDVRITFYQKTTVLFYNGLFGKVYAIQLVAFMINFRFRRVDVLHLDTFGGTGKYASSEGHHLAGESMYRKDDPPPEAVAQSVVVRFVAEAGLDEIIFFVSFIQGFQSEGVVALGTVTQLKLLDDVIAEAAAAEIGHADASAVNMVLQDILEVVAGKVVYDKEAFPFALCYLFLTG